MLEDQSRATGRKIIHSEDLTDDGKMFAESFGKRNSHDLVFYTNRSTPQVVHRNTPHRPKVGYGDVSSRRPASATEEDWMEKTQYKKWLRVDEAGNTPRSPDYAKTQYRPWLVSKSAFGVEHGADLSKSYVGGGKYLPITAKGVLRQVKSHKLETGKMTPNQGVERDDMLDANHVSDTMEWARINGARKPIKIPKKEEKILRAVAGRKVKTVRIGWRGSSATDLAPEPIMNRPKKKTRKREVKDVLRDVNAGIDPISRADVVAHEAAHLTETPKRMRGPSKLARRAYRKRRFENKYGTRRAASMEEARADVVASRKMGRTIRSGHTNEPFYWETRNRIERNMGVPETPKFSMPRRKYAPSSYLTDDEIMGARKVVSENRDYKNARKRNLKIADHDFLSHMLKLSGDVVDGTDSVHGSKFKKIRWHQPGQTDDKGRRLVRTRYTYPKLYKLEDSIRDASNLTRKERKAANKKYTRQFKAKRSSAVAEFRRRNPNY
jgi:hypothetical protein